MAEQNPAKESAAIRQMFQDWEEGVRSKDISRLLDFITEDAVFMPPGQPLIRGKSQVEALYKMSFEKFTMDQKFQIEEIQICGDWAFVWGVDSAVLTPTDGGPAIQARGMGISILQRQPDGLWKFSRGINNMTKDELT
jgi:uncharacterized protein (TIGR02246 family)